MNEKNVKTVAFCTLGCKVNQYETDAMMELFGSHGYEVIEFSGKADVYVVNTCSVTSMADRKSRQMLHRAKKKNPGSVIVATGCYVQTAGDALLEDGSIDLIIGNNQKKDIVDIVESYRHTFDSEYTTEDNRKISENTQNTENIEKKSYIKDLNHKPEYEQLNISTVSEHTRAYIKIQDGCNQFCSYCIIPYARGRVRSRNEADIVAEVKRLTANHYKEIVLTGIHISSYGMDFEGENYNDHPHDGSHLLHLIQSIAQVEGVMRIRLGSLEPQIITDEFAKALSEIPQICAHFHLSLQSGCDATLKRMNRHYTAEEYKRGCDTLRRWFDHPALTTDVIVGFPGETDEEFEICKAFLEDISFAQMHIFKYSKRQGTRAAVMENQVDEQIKTKRSDILLALDAKLQQKYRDFWAERTMEVLLEEDVEIDGKTYMTGHSKEYIKVAVPKNNEKSNDIIKVKSIGQNSKEFMNCERMD